MGSDVSGAGRVFGFLARLRRYVGDRRRSPRRGARVAARLPVTVTPLGDAEEFAPRARPSLGGSTRDLSARGLTLLLPGVRVGGRYLTDAEGYVGVRLETPAGTLSILAAPARFEQLDAATGEGYHVLLGLRILRMSDGDRDAYLAYLRTLAPSERRARERGRPAPEPAPSGAWSEVTPSAVAEAFERFLHGDARV